jgi:hypothetical protein
MANQIGHFSRTSYDSKSIRDDIQESTDPFNYIINSNYSGNCNACVSNFGPRPSNGSRSYGVSTVAQANNYAPAQALTDVESILQNRNVLASGSKDGSVNNIDVSKFTLNHPRTCSNFLDPMYTHLTDPVQNYKGVAINRFYDLPKDPQANIFYSWAVNTKLEAIDNYRERLPQLPTCDRTLPIERR